MFLFQSQVEDLTFVHGKRRSENDALLYHEAHRAGRVRNLQLRNYETVRFPAEGDCESVITLIKAEDPWKDGTNGYIEIKSGGAGAKHVELLISSQILRGFHFIIEIYGENQNADESSRTMGEISADGSNLTMVHQARASGDDGEDNSLLEGEQTNGTGTTDKVRKSCKFLCCYCAEGCGGTMEVSTQCGGFKMDFKHMDMTTVRQRPE